ncbi:MAG TPA: cation:proton antiporter [Kiritimatiellia bacterium]|nr:cation:proton antiporter [Kiritimatiellia bacterium]
MHVLSEHHIYLFLLQLLLLLGLARVAGELFRMIHQPPITAEILVGIVLGPTLFGRYFPEGFAWLFPADPLQQSMLETVGWIGVLFLLLQTGLEIDFASAWRQRGEAVRIALADIFLPMAVAFVPFFLLPAHYLVDPEQRFLFAFFMATALTISALPIAARVLHDLHLTKTDLGFLLMSALSVNDIIGWLIFSLVLSFSLHADIEVGRTLLIVVGTVGFTALCLTYGRGVTHRAMSQLNAWKMPQPGTSLTFLVLLGLLCGAITEKIGIHALFGFFIAGIMAGSSRALNERSRQVISQMVFAVFVPVFFASIGLSLDFVANFNWFLVVLVTGVGIAGRYFGAWVGVTITHLPRANRSVISIAHTPGGAMEIVVGVIALEYGLITEPMFIALVFGAIFSSVIVGPWMRASLRRRPEVSLLEFFSGQGVVAAVKAGTREEAIATLCEVAAEQGPLPSGTSLADAVLRREADMGTGVEEGIALPHARLKGLVKPVVVFGRSPLGIEWDSPDGKPAQFIFLILTPEDDADLQVQLLSNLVGVMGDEAARRGLLEAEGAEELWARLKNAVGSRQVVRRKRG